MKKALVLGAGGFIGSHMVKRLKLEGYWVRGVDLKKPEYSKTEADDFVVGDLRNPNLVSLVITDDIDELYQFAADMGGAGYIFTGEHDADVMHNSALINLNVVYESVKKNVKKYFILLLPVYIQNRIKKIQIILIVKKVLLILQCLILNMVGKNYLVREYINHFREIMD